MNLAPPRGMRDFYPEDMRIRNRIFDAWKRAAHLYGFEEYDAPVVETEELLTRKSGEEIIQQIYNFTDKSNRRLALRPEMTPSLARMVIARQKQLTYPLKWFSIPQCFRYERMTKGRKREHFQWNLDVVGEPGLMAETEILGAAITALRLLGLSEQDFRVRIGSRALLADLFKASGLAEQHFLPVCLVLDKMGKISPDEMQAMLRDEGLTPTEIKKVIDLMSITSIDEAAAYLNQVTPAIAEVRELFAIMTTTGLAAYLEFDMAIIRGLSYYTGIVFEAFDRQQKFRAIFGGGRYDNLLNALGGETMPSVGLGFGDVVIQELLTALDKLNDEKAAAEILMGYMTPAERDYALQVATAFRNDGIPVDLALMPEKAKKLFSRANKMGTRYTIFIGPDEVHQQTISLKNMITGESQRYSLSALKAGNINLH